jgi:hypothetical protein
MDLDSIRSGDNKYASRMNSEKGNSFGRRASKRWIGTDRKIKSKKRCDLMN